MGRRLKKPTRSELGEGMLGREQPLPEHTCCCQLSQRGLSGAERGLGPLKAREGAQDPYKEARTSRAKGLEKQRARRAGL